MKTMSQNQVYAHIVYSLLRTESDIVMGSDRFEVLLCALRIACLGSDSQVAKTLESSLQNCPSVRIHLDKFLAQNLTRFINESDL
jgi:hypothetical protein